VEKAFHSGWLEIEGKLIGLNLGADYTAEHEIGISDLKRAFGIDGANGGGFGMRRTRPTWTKPAGIARRMITKHDMVRLYMLKGKTKALLISEQKWVLERMDKHVEEKGVASLFKTELPRGVGVYGDEKLGCAWSDNDFGILGIGENVAKIVELHEAIMADKAAIWLGGGHVFQNAGLVICIADRIPQDKLDLLKEADLDVEKLQAASDATGITKRLEEAKKGYFACSPHWFNKEFKPQNQEKKSAHPVIYWLNPMEQNDNNYGWYTVEELDQWIEGKGPIPKAK
jgi:hypothetical protein